MQPQASGENNVIWGRFLLTSWKGLLTRFSKQSSGYDIHEH